MHCSQLTDLRGIGAFTILRELNVSSNSILSMSGLEELRHLENLNLSCNKIAQIHGLRQMAKTLKVLNLSHNRIVSLQSMQEIADVAVLQVLDLTDNYIGELQNVKCLQNFRHLKELSFQKADDSSKGSNPICDFQNYHTTVSLYLPYLQKLDGCAKGQNDVRPSTAPVTGKLATGKMATEFSHRRDLQTLSPDFQLQSFGPDQVVLQLHNKLTQKEQVIERLHQELRDANHNLETISTERTLLLSRFDQNEKLWQDRLDKKQQECGQLLTLHESLKDDHRQVVI